MIKKRVLFIHLPLNQLLGLGEVHIYEKGFFLFVFKSKSSSHWTSLYYMYDMW